MERERRERERKGRRKRGEERGDGRLLELPTVHPVGSFEAAGAPGEEVVRAARGEGRSRRERG